MSQGVATITILQGYFGPPSSIRFNLTLSRLSQLDLLLNDLRRAVDELVQDARDGEDAADDGAESREEVAEGLLLLAVLDHEGGELVLEEHPRHPALAAHQGHHLLVLGHGVLCEWTNDSLDLLALLVFHLKGNVLCSRLS